MIKDITGQKFGRLTAIKFFGIGKRRMAIWVFQCDCGNKHTAAGRWVTSGNTKSCGCLVKTHGMSRTNEYSRWATMIARCTNPNSSEYHRYGGRGITVCDHWRNSFEAFRADMGSCPPGFSIERKDVNGNYEPGNCCWAGKVAQANNRRGNRLLTMRGVTQTIAQWSRATGLPASVIGYRLRKLKWADEKILTSPVGVMDKPDRFYSIDLKNLSAQTGITVRTIRRRMDAGWSLADAISAPVSQQSLRLKKGEVMNVFEKALKLGMPPNTIYGRIRLGWSLDEALSTPITKKRKPPETVREQHARVRG